MPDLLPIVGNLDHVSFMNAMPMDTESEMVVERIKATVAQNAAVTIVRGRASQETASMPFTAGWTPAP